MLKRTLPLVALSLAAAFSAAQTEIVITANNPVLGDVVPATGVDTFVPLVNHAGYGYNNIRFGTAGIDSTYARSGNGSFHITNVDGKADLEFYSPLSGGDFSLGRLADLTSFGYEYFRAGSSTASPTLAPVFRLLVDADGNSATSNDRGTVVYEPIYSRNQQGINPNTVEDVWNTVAATPTDGQLFIRFGGQNQYQGENGSIANGVTLSYLTDPTTTSSLQPLNNGLAAIYGFSVGYGTGFGGSFDGAVDNVQLGFNGAAGTTYNFERTGQPVPEPATMAALGLGAVALLRRRRKAAK